MARKTIPSPPARDRSREDESLLLRSAESLGRVIGSLQRQLDIATGRLDGSKANGSVGRKTAAKRSVKAKSGATTSRGGARKKSTAGTSAARRSAKKR
ncbi:MAG TPA: hypothetical protein VKC35_13920 [Vicinamibacterales bacterium]|nr:hypothetical protein [Vicinamibacterales bacterium]